MGQSREKKKKEKSTRWGKEVMGILPLNNNNNNNGRHLPRQTFLLLDDFHGKFQKVTPMGNLVARNAKRGTSLCSLWIFNEISHGFWKMADIKAMFTLWEKKK